VVGLKNQVVFKRTFVEVAEELNYVYVWWW